MASVNLYSPLLIYLEAIHGHEVGDDEDDEEEQEAVHGARREDRRTVGPQSLPSLPVIVAVTFEFTERTVTDFTELPG